MHDNWHHKKEGKPDFLCPCSHISIAFEIVCWSNSKRSKLANWYCVNNAWALLRENGLTPAILRTSYKNKDGIKPGNFEYSIQ